MGVNLVWNEGHGPHQVFTDMRIENLSNVDTIAQTFECSFTVTF